MPFFQVKFRPKVSVKPKFGRPLMPQSGKTTFVSTPFTTKTLNGPSPTPLTHTLSLTIANPTLDSYAPEDHIK